LRRRRFQTGCVRSRKDRSPAYWAGFYREDVVTKAGKTERKRRYVNLGLLKDLPSERAARQKLALILERINNFSQSSKVRITFREFIEKYRSLKLVIKKGTTTRGYETNIRAHYLARFGEMQLSQISIELVQEFLSAKTVEGKSAQTIKNLK
jgi:Phage integrase, N-terminal SAM-like domain